MLEFGKLDLTKEGQLVYIKMFNDRLVLGAYLSKIDQIMLVCIKFIVKMIFMFY